MNASSHPEQTSPQPPVPSEALASWTPPAWATHSRAEDGGARHERQASTPAWRDADWLGHPPVPVLPIMFATDVLDFAAGVASVERTAAVVLVEDLELNVEQARVLALGILELVDAAAAATAATATAGAL